MTNYHMPNAINISKEIMEAMFKVRKTHCAYSKTLYEEYRSLFNCQVSTNIYHCIKDNRNRSIEICIQPVWVKPNYCPKYLTGSYNLDVVPCNESTRSCPGVEFLSNEVYKYPVCLNTTFIPDQGMIGDEQVSKDNVLPLPWILVGVVLLFICLVFIAYCVGCRIRRNLKRKNQRRCEESYPLVPQFASKEPFYRSAAFHEGVNFIVNGGKLLCLVGQWGSGKTSTAKQVYKFVTNAPPIVIHNYFTFNVCDRPVIFDDTISNIETGVEKDQFSDIIRKLYENMSRSGTNPFIIITLDENIKHSYNFVKSLLPCNEDVKFIDLSKKLTKGDRTQILHSQFEAFSPNRDFSKVEHLALKGMDHSLGYPEICALFCRSTYFQNVGPTIFCSRPLQYLKKYLESMHYSTDNEKFLMLVYMSLNHMEINVNSPGDVLFEILMSCDLDNNCITTQMKSSKTTIREGSEAANDSYFGIKPKKKKRNKEYIASLLSKEFVVKEADSSIYRLQHDVIKRMVLIVFGTYHFDKLLQYSKQEDLKGWIRKKNTLYNPYTQGDIQPFLELKTEHLRHYQAKMSKTAS